VEDHKSLIWVKSKTKEGVDQKQKLLFADVAGADDAKAELIEIVQFLKEPKNSKKLGLKFLKVYF